MTNAIFGDWKGIPAEEWGHYVDTPVGQVCIGCHEPIQEGDTGQMMVCLTANGSEERPQHRECLLLGVVGHAYGVCSCNDYGGTGSRRRGALLLDTRMRRNDNA